jgi:hypothetical protein
VVAACGGSSGSQQTTTVPSAALQQAAYASSAASGYKAQMRLRETIGPVHVVMSGAGSFSPPKHTGSLVFRLSEPPAVGSAIGHAVRVRAVYSGADVYLKLPALSGKLPAGKPWLSMDVSKLAQAEGIPGLSSLVSGTSSLNDPGRYLSYLRATAAGSVQNLGQATVNGVQTTHYHAEIDLTKLADAVPASSREGVQQLVAALEKKGSATTIPIDAWIDNMRLVRRLVLNYVQQVASIGESARVSLKMDFVDYGPQATPRIPPASETTDLLTLLRAQM